MAVRLRSQTVMTLDWIARRLQMGVVTRCLQAGGQFPLPLHTVPDKDRRKPRYETASLRYGGAIKMCPASRAT